MKYKFSVNCVKWFDKYNGNTYHSNRIINLENGDVIHCEFQYGYGDHYRQTALNAILEAGWIDKKYGEPYPNGGNHVFDYERENNYPILWNEREGLKRDCIANGRS